MTRPPARRATKPTLTPAPPLDGQVRGQDGTRPGTCAADACEGRALRGSLFCQPCEARQGLEPVATIIPRALGPLFGALAARAAEAEPCEQP